MVKGVWKPWHIQTLWETPALNKVLPRADAGSLG